MLGSLKKLRFSFAIHPAARDCYAFASLRENFSEPQFRWAQIYSRFQIQRPKFPQKFLQIFLGIRMQLRGLMIVLDVSVAGEACVLSLLYLREPLKTPFSS